MANILGSSPVARTVDITRNQFSGWGVGSEQSSLVPLIKNIQEKNDIQDKIISQEQVSLNTVSFQLTDFSAQLNEINVSLQRIASYISQDTALELRQEREKQNKELLLAQESARSEKEQVVERRIQSALSKPIEAIGKRVQGALSNVMGFFGTLFLGWLTNQGISAIQANAEGARNKLEEIKNNVLNAFGFVYKILVVVRGAVDIITGTITSTVAKITRFLAIDVIGGLFKKLGDIGKALVEGAQNLLPKPPPAPASAASAATTAAGEAAESAGKNLTAEAATSAASKATTEVAERRGGNLLSRLIPGVGTAVNLGIAGYRFSAGDPLGGALSLGSAVPGPVGWLATLADVSRDLGAWDQKAQAAEAPKPTTTQAEQKPITPTASKVPQISALPTPKPPEKPKELPKEQPQPNITPIKPKVEMSAKSTTVTTDTGSVSAAFNPTINLTNFGKIYASPEEEKMKSSTMDFSQPPSYGNISGDVQSISMEPEKLSTKVESQKPPQQISSIAPINVAKMQPKQEQQIGRLPEPKPNVIVAPMQQPQQMQQTNAVPSVSGEANKIPVIPSANPDNFYALYSQVSYNVVI